MSQPTYQIFDRSVLRIRREKAVLARDGYDFLYEETACRLIERLEFIKKKFPLVLNLGAARGNLTQRLMEREGTQQVIAVDAAYGAGCPCDGVTVAADEEFLPFKPDSFSAVVSNLALQWVNDVPGALLQIKQAMQDDGLFLAALVGGESLRELREALLLAEMQVTGGASVRVSPMMGLQDLAGLLQRTGFALPVADTERITVHYKDMFGLMRDLRGMGAANVALNRLKKSTRRQVFLEAARIYNERFAEGDGLIPATFDILFAIGWKPHASQPQPLKRGSAAVSLVDALK